MRRVLCAVALATVAVATASAVPPVPIEYPSLVQLVHRHGDRAPIQVAPNTRQAWAQMGVGAGELSPVGAQQLRAFGRLVRQRYVTDLPEPLINATHYDYRELVVRSSDVDRTLQSVQELLSQVYPGQSIPIHTTPQIWDNLLQSADHCASYVSAYLQADLQLSAQIAQNLTYYQPLIDAAQQWTGWSAAYVAAFPGGVSAWLGVVDDNLACALAHGLPLTPAMAQLTPAFHAFKRLYNFRHFAMNNTLAPVGTSNMYVPDARGAVGAALVSTFLNNVDAHIAGTAALDRSLFVYSAHDDTVTATYTGLGLGGSSGADNANGGAADPQPPAYDPLQGDMYVPPYAASVVLEYYASPLGSTYPGTIYAYWGAPVRNTSVADPAAGGAWTYALHPLTIHCPGGAPASNMCAYSGFASYLRDPTNGLLPPLAADGVTSTGCCVHSVGWDASGCANTTADATSAQSANCALYRQWCPGSSCGEGQILTYDSQVCVDMGDATPTIELCYRWLLLGVVLMLLIGGGLYCCGRTQGKAEAAAAATSAPTATSPAAGGGHAEPLLAAAAAVSPATTNPHSDEKAPLRVESLRTINDAGVGAVVSSSAPPQAQL